jgi:hypothetical protein
MNKRLTLIRRASNAIDSAMIRAQFGDAIQMDNLRRARSWLKKAKMTTLGGNAGIADLSLRNACTHLNLVLCRIDVLAA